MSFCEFFIEIALEEEGFFQAMEKMKKTQTEPQETDSCTHQSCDAATWRASGLAALPSSAASCNENDVLFFYSRFRCKECGNNDETIPLVDLIQHLRFLEGLNLVAGLEAGERCREKRLLKVLFIERVSLEKLILRQL